jgi:uncharacterized membrane protein
MLVLIHPGQAMLQAANILGLLIFCAAVLCAPWRRFLSQRSRPLVWLGYAVVLALLWSLRVAPNEVLAFHISAIAAAVFVFGLRLTLLMGAFALMINQLVVPLPDYTWALNFLLSAAMPAIAVALFGRVIHRLPSNNLFVFMLGGGFLGAVLGVLATSAGAYLLFYWFASPSLAIVLLDYWPVVAMSLFPEGFIGGGVLTTFTVLWPGLVKLYDDQRYLS